MRNNKGIAALGTATAIGLPLGASTPAAATRQQVQSTPGGRFAIITSVLSQTNADGDGNPDTATSGDTVRAVYSVRNNTRVARNVTITVVLDAPGTAGDASYTEQRTIPAHSIAREVVPITVTSDVPDGEYVVSLTAAQAAERGTATARLVVH